MSHLLEFYGTECPHCERMHVLIERLEKEEGIKVERFEIWHNKENEKKMKELDKGLCGGVPFFFNAKTKKYICGERDYETVLAWAKGKPFKQK